jgi:hypothetical protein
VDSSSRPSEGPVHGVRDLPNPEIVSVRQGIPATMAQAGSRCGPWIVSAPETALRSAGDLVDVGCCRAPEVTPRPSESAGVEPRPTRRRSPTAQLVSPSHDCVLCVAQHANGGVVGAHDHRPGRARGAGVSHAGAGLCERGRRVPRRGPDGRGARARPGGRGRSPRSSPAATRQVRRSRNRIRYRDTAPVLGRIRASWTSYSRLSLRTTRIHAATTPSCRGALHRQGVGGPASRAALPLTPSAFAIA